MAKGYPSRMYISPRTRYWRRIYFIAAALVILAIAIATLFSLSEKSKEPDPETEQEQIVKEESKPITKPQPQTERFSLPIQIKPQPAFQPESENIEQKPLDVSKPRTEKEPEPKPEPQKSEIIPEPIRAITASEKATVIINDAKKLIRTQPMKIIKAREMLNEVLGMDISSQQRAEVKNLLSELADKWLFSKDVYPGDNLCRYYRIKSGDLLSTIGRRNKVPWEILKQINGIYNPATMQADQSIKIIQGPFHAKIYKSKFVMDVYLKDTFVKSFPIGLGDPSKGHDTPTGLWRVESGGKLVKPRWTDPDSGRIYEPSDPDYPLGSRWIALEGIEGNAVGRDGFAIHGTQKPEEIGVAKSRGCIRLHNGNAILVYNLMVPIESKVVVAE